MARQDRVRLLCCNGAAAREPRMPSPPADPRHLRPPSMGPRLASRGCSGPSFSYRTPCPFNGAAAREPRMQALVERIAALENLQWGRGSRAADALHLPVEVIPVDGPSMGPRLASRGCWHDNFWGVCACDLQWGRGSRAADALIPRRDLRRRKAFNGAAAREPRMPLPPIRQKLVCWPSMGPRLASRGCARYSSS